LRTELQQIFERRSAVVVYTTTEPAEALMLGGNIVVMDEGRILQAGPTPEVYRHPATMRVAEIFSDPPINFIKGRVHDKQAQLGEAIRLPLNGHMAQLPSGPYIFGVRCNHLFLKSTSPHDVAVQVMVELCEINGSETFIHIGYENTSLVVQDDGVHQLKIGREITVYVNPCHFFVYDPEGKLVASPDQPCFTGT
jgi:glycerol transport system ATP-binding protein